MTLTEFSHLTSEGQWPVGFLWLLHPKTLYLSPRNQTEYRNIKNHLGGMGNVEMWWIKTNKQINTFYASPFNVTGCLARRRWGSPVQILSDLAQSCALRWRRPLGLIILKPIRARIIIPLMSGNASFREIFRQEGWCLATRQPDLLYEILPRASYKSITCQRWGIWLFVAWAPQWLLFMKIQVYEQPTSPSEESY